MQEKAEAARRARSALHVAEEQAKYSFVAPIERELGPTAKNTRLASGRPRPWDKDGEVIARVVMKGIRQQAAREMVAEAKAAFEEAVNMPLQDLSDPDLSGLPEVDLERFWETAPDVMARFVERPQHYMGWYNELEAQLREGEEQDTDSQEDPDDSDSGGAEAVADALEPGDKASSEDRMAIALCEAFGVRLDLKAIQSREVKAVVELLEIIAPTRACRLTQEQRQALQKQGRQARIVLSFIDWRRNRKAYLAPQGDTYAAQRRRGMIHRVASEWEKR